MTRQDDTEVIVLCLTDQLEQLLPKLLCYDPVNGRLSWKPRDRSLFKSDPSWKTWNIRFAGKEAGTVNAVRGYRYVSIWGRGFLAHRICWLLQTGEWPADQIDHINGKRSDNRWINLRSVTNTQNSQNEKLRKTNKSGVTGVYLRKDTGKWTAEIKVSGRKICLGSFGTKGEASAARKWAEKRLGFHPNHGRR